MKFVLDVSNWDSNYFSVSCLKQAGVEGIILGYQIPVVSDTMGAKAREGGIPVLGTYAFLWDVETPDIRVQKAIDGAKKNGCKIVWLDVEQGDTMPALQQRLADVRAGVAAVRAAGLEPGIYTGQYFWPVYMANSTEFSALKLWHSNWGQNDGNQPPITTVNYGGWTKVSVHQYASSVVICGRVRDTNHYMLEDVVAPPADLAELREIVMQLVRVVAGHGTPDPLDSLAGLDDDGINLTLYIDGVNATALRVERKIRDIGDAALAE